MAKEDERLLGRRPETIGTIADGIHDINHFGDFKLPEGKWPTQIAREEYWSMWAISSADGQLYTLDFPDGSKTFVLHQRATAPFVNKGQVNPWAHMGMIGGADMRPWETFVYEWNGKRTIRVTDPTDKITRVVGKQGTPDAMLPTLRKTLKGEYPGELRDTKRFAGKKKELSPEAKWLLKDIDDGISETDRQSANQALKQGLEITEEGRELLTFLGERGLTKRGALIFITGNNVLPISRGYHRLEVLKYLVEGETKRHLIGFLGGRGRILISSDDNQQLEETGEMFQAIEYRPDLGAIITQNGAAKCLVDNLGRRISRNYMDLLVRDGQLYGARGESYERVKQHPAKNRSISPIGIAWQDLIKDVESSVARKRILLERIGMAMGNLARDVES